MLLEPIAARRSPRAFDPHHELSDAEFNALLEAARWAPSAMNRQPWAFLAGLRDDPSFKGIADALNGNNQLWAPSASLLLVALVDNDEEHGPTSVGRAYELGLAVGQLGIQAAAMGLITHQMGGFDHDQLRREFAIPDRYRPMAVIAVGAIGDPADLPEHLQRRERAARVRRSIDQLLFTQPWEAA